LKKKLFSLFEICIFDNCKKNMLFKLTLHMASIRQHDPILYPSLDLRLSFEP